MAHFTRHVVVAAMALVLATAQDCPTRCRSCTNSIANCQRRSLTAPPKSYPPDIKVINLQENHIRLLGSRTFHRNQPAEVLKLSHNKINAIRDNAFLSFPHLMSLDLAANKISRIDPTGLNRMPRLRTLNLNRNRIRQITNVFHDTPNLHQLNLAKNKIVTIRESDLASLTKVHYLDLRDNRIRNIHRNAFQQMTRLRYLFLNNNPIAQHLDLNFGSAVLQLLDISNCQLPRVPETLPSTVTDLRLGKNNIMQINHTDFQNINDLQMLALNDNELHFLADGTFSHLTQLKEIWLRGNNLVYVPRDIPNNVEKVFMDSNRIQEIEAGLFSNESMLSSFSAENNRLQRVNPGTFVDMGNLMTINLQGNQIQTLESMTFANLPSLHTLLLSNNLLHRIDAGAFHNLPNLTHLHLSYLAPESTEVQDNFLVAMPQLETLSVMASPGMAQALVDMVEGASEEDFIIMPSLKTLDLTYNDLQWLSPRFTILFPNVESVLLDGNPFFCTNTLRWLQTWMSDSSITFHTYEEVMCQTPEFLRGRVIGSLTEQEWGQASLTRQRQKRRHRNLNFVMMRGNQNQHPSGRNSETKKYDTHEVGRPRYAEARKASALQSNSQRNRERDIEEARRRQYNNGEAVASSNYKKEIKNETEAARRRSDEETRRRKYEESLRVGINSGMAKSSDEKVTRSKALRAARKERRRKMRNRSRSRSRKGGKRRKNKRRGRKGRKGRKTKRERQIRNRSRVKRNDQV